jgi:hypothetical protein
MDIISFFSLPLILFGFSAPQAEVGNREDINFSKETRVFKKKNPEADSTFYLISPILIPHEY